MFKRVARIVILAVLLVAVPGTALAVSVSSANAGMSPQGVKVHHCRNVNNLPDPCGSWSALIPRP